MAEESSERIRNRTIRAASAWFAVAVVSGIIGASIVLMRFSAISPEAFASFLVAAGTLALAYFTALSVVRTNDVIAAEDRRHQQSLAPLLTVQADAQAHQVEGGRYEVGIWIKNIGYGVALNIEVTLEAVVEYSVYPLVEDTNENRALFEGKFKPFENSVINGKSYLNLTKRESEAFDRSITISALPVGTNHFQYEQEFADRQSGKAAVRYSLAVASYYDMFGNKYSTKYLDEELARYDWHQPKHLRIPNPESR